MAEDPILALLAQRAEDHRANADRWRAEHAPSCAAVKDAAAEELDALAELLPPLLAKRDKQVAEECAKECDDSAAEWKRCAKRPKEQEPADCYARAEEAAECAAAIRTHFAKGDRPDADH